jgi:hypothetical protein
VPTGPIVNRSPVNPWTPDIVHGEGEEMLLNAGNLDLITFAFGVFNVLRLGSYMPQIIAVARDRHGATAISFSCWTIWVGANASTSLYAWVKLGDVNLSVISAFNAACCLAVLLLAAYKRFVAQRFAPAP